MNGIELTKIAKGYRTHIFNAVGFISATSMLLLSLGVIDTGITAEQLNTISVFLTSMVVFSTAMSSRFRALANRDK